MIQTLVFFALCFIPIWTFSENSASAELEAKAIGFVENYDFMADEREDRFSIETPSLKVQSQKPTGSLKKLITLAVTGEAELEISEARKIRNYHLECIVVFKDSEVLRTDSHCKLKEVPWL
ncbi:MAG: hypothetical protein AB7O96_17555 [Pseudobdellovibrionaceae bacterium]